MNNKEPITENKVVLREQGETDFLLNKQVKNNCVNIDQAKRLIAEIIKQA